VSYQVLARKWRPQLFEEVIEQKHVVKTLQNAITGNRIAHAFLFTGQRGVGKTSIARILAKALNCKEGPTPRPCGKCSFCKEITEGNAIDILEIDGASNTGVDDVRGLREDVKYVPARGRYKIYIIDEVHMLSKSAFNALLKTLEEPPAHVIFMFATTEVHKIPATVLSRCQRFDLRRLSSDMVVKHLAYIASREHITISEQGLRWIAREAEGSMRDAQSILDRVISYAGDKIEDKDIVAVLGLVDRALLMRTSQAIMEKDAKECLDIVSDLFRSGYDINQFYQEFLEHLRNLIVVKISKKPDQLMELSSNECDLLKEQVKDSELETLQRLFDIWLKAEEEINRSSLPQTVLEMVLLKMVYLKSLLPLDDALAKLDELEKKFLHGKIGIKKDVEPPRSLKPPKYEETQESVNEPPQLRDEPDANAPHYSGEDNPEQAWEKIQALIKKEKPMLAAVLEHGQLMHIKEKEIELGFASDSIFLDSAKDADNELQLKNICEKFFGRKLRVKVTSVREEGKKKLPVRSTPGEKESGDEREGEVTGTSLVNEALSIFNGKIVELKGEDLITK
jgi:DNA polymerase-3 subunit gamma/tau